MTQISDEWWITVGVSATDIVVYSVLKKLLLVHNFQAEKQRDWYVHYI